MVDGISEHARESQAVRSPHWGRARGVSREVRRTCRGALILDQNAPTRSSKSNIVMQASITVHEHEIVALLGRNGAGKSTLLKTIVGIVNAQGGRILLSGDDLARRPAAANARSGIGYVPQGRGLFAGMSVRHNLELGRLKRRKGEGVAWSNAKILEFFPRLRARLDTPADFLSGGEQQMVAVARALSGHVRVLLLDEPFEGLAPAVIEELFEAFDRLRQELSIVIVEHNLDLVLALADQAYVLERGSVVHHGPAAALRDDLHHAPATDVNERIAAISALDRSALAVWFARAGWTVRLLTRAAGVADRRLSNQQAGQLGRTRHRPTPCIRWAMR